MKNESQLEQPHDLLIPFLITPTGERIKLDAKLLKMHKGFLNLVREYNIDEENPIKTVLGKRRSPDDMSITRATTISRISTITKDEFQNILNQRGLVRYKIDFRGATSSSSIQPYEWTEQSEEKQIKPCIEWMKRNIPIPEYLTFNILSNVRDALNIPPGDPLDFGLVGTTDAVISNKDIPNGDTIISKTHVVFELKKNTHCLQPLEFGDTQSQRQAITELIAANIKTDYPVIVILTDLNESWFIAWLEPGEAYSTIIKRSEDAIGFIRTFLATSDLSYCQSTIPRTKTDEDVQLKGDVSESVLEYARNIPKIFPPRELADVAPMRELFDDMSPAEVEAWRSKQWKEIVSNTFWLKPKKKEPEKKTNKKTIYKRSERQKNGTKIKLTGPRRSQRLKNRFKQSSIIS